MLGALAAYAFSRFRFRGRRMGMVALLLIQMFPQIVAVAAIYLLVLNVGDIFRPIGLNTLLAVIIVYLGGAMGVQTWLMKGFFDTIPKELDESARVDGATAGADLLGRRPAARRAGARRRRADLVRLHAERVRARLGAAPDERPLHAAGRHAGLHRPAVRPALGAVRRRRR